jgi:hypothetical protein
MRHDHIGTIREFRTKHFRVIVDADFDHDIDLSWDEDGRTARALDSGEPIHFQVEARVILKDTGQELGHDALGGCIRESIEAFADHRACGKQNRKWARQGKDGRCGSYFSGPIGEAIAEARKNLTRTKDVLGTVHLRTPKVRTA